MDELRVIKPDKNNRISHDDLQWIGASECIFVCAACESLARPLYEYWEGDERYCAKCLIEGWEEATPESDGDD